MSRARVDRFIAALHALEDRRDWEGILGLFAPDAILGNPVFDPPLRGPAGARQFWERYRSNFRQVHSTFERIIVEGDQAALEWHADSVLRQGNRPLRYRGVTLLDFAGEQIRRLQAYYDPRPFLEALRRPPEEIAPYGEVEIPLGALPEEEERRERHYQLGPYGTTAGPPD